MPDPLLKIRIQGRYQDTLLRADGSTVEFEERSNQIQDDGLVILASLLRHYDWPINGSGHPQWMGVGFGSAAWDADWPTPPTRDTSENSLVDEQARVAVADVDWRWVNDLGAEVLIPTDKVRAIVTIEPGVATGLVREFGFFGGDSEGAPGVNDLMMNWVPHEAIPKGALDTLIRRMTFVFTAVFGPEEIPMSYFSVNETGELTMKMNAAGTSSVTIDYAGPAASARFLFYLGGTLQGILDETGWQTEGV